MSCDWVGVIYSAGGIGDDDDGGGAFEQSCFKYRLDSGGFSNRSISRVSDWWL